MCDKSYSQIIEERNKEIEDLQTVCPHIQIRLHEEIKTQSGESICKKFKCVHCNKMPLDSTGTPLPVYKTLSELLAAKSWNEQDMKGIMSCLEYGLNEEQKTSLLGKALELLSETVTG